MNKIFAHFIPRGERNDDSVRVAYASWFVETIPSNEFKTDEFYFYSFLRYCVDLEVVASYRHLNIWTSTELRKLIHSTGEKVSGCETLNLDDPASFETVYRTTVNVLEDDYRVLETEPNDVEGFVTDITAYFSETRKQRITEILAESFEILNNTDDAEATMEFLQDSGAFIQEIYSQEAIEELTSTGRASQEQLYCNMITDFGIPAIDSDSLGVYGGQLFGIEAQPGTGKTRFALGCPVYRALVEHKKNVYYSSGEQSLAELEDMLIAKHVFQMFDIQITDQMVLRGRVPEELQHYVDAARIDLFESGKYGKFYAKKEILYVENFISHFKTLDKLHGPFDLYVIDYMGLMESRPQKYQRLMQDYEIIGQGFKLFKRWLLKTGKAGIAVSQLNSKGTEAGERDKKITPDMAQGGMTVYRNTDYNTAITMTDTMRLQQKRKVQQPKVRGSAGFSDFIMDTRLGFLYFAQAKRKDV